MHKIMQYIASIIRMQPTYYFGLICTQIIYISNVSY